MMSYTAWKDEFNGDLAALGKSYAVDGEPRLLVGVMPPRFHAFGPATQIWMPITWNSGAAASGAELRLNLLGRLRRGATLEAASSNLEVIANGLAATHPHDFPKKFTARVESAEDFLMGPKGGRPNFPFRRKTFGVRLAGCRNDLAADCLQQCGESAAGSRDGAGKRNRHAIGPGRHTRAAGSAAFSGKLSIGNQRLRSGMFPRVDWIEICGDGVAADGRQRFSFRSRRGAKWWSALAFLFWPLLC